MSCPKHEEILTFVRRELPPAQAREIDVHLDDCQACRDEVAWLRAERALLQRRALDTRPPEDQWEKIRERLAATRPAPQVRLPARRRGSFAGMAAGLVAAAAAILFLLPGHHRHHKDKQPQASSTRPDASAEPEHRADTLAAIDRAEKDYGHAIELLEQEYQEQRSQLPAAEARRRDLQVQGLRRELDDLRAIAGNDVDGRLRVLHASAEYVRTMQTIVLEEEMP